MRLASYVLDGRASYGMIEGERVLDLGSRLGANYPDLKTLIAAGAYGEARRAVSGAAADATVSELVFLPVIPK